MTMVNALMAPAVAHDKPGPNAKDVAAHVSAGFT